MCKPNGTSSPSVLTIFPSHRIFEWMLSIFPSHRIFEWNKINTK